MTILSLSFRPRREALAAVPGSVGAILRPGGVGPADLWMSPERRWSSGVLQ